MRCWSLLALCLLFLLAGCGKSNTSASPKRESKYPKLTVEILKSLPDDQLEDAIRDYVSSKIDNYEHEFEIVTALPKEFQMVYATWYLEAEVYNGGFNQYFWNPSGKFQQQALDGYKLIGANAYAELVAEAIKINATQEAKMKNYKDDNSLKGFSESYKDNPLNDCDSKFYKLTEKADVLRTKFIRNHLDSFVGS